jgi:hypothetical protein
VLLALGLWRLPTIYRRRKMRNIYLGMSFGQLAAEALKAEIYTDDQTRLLIQLSLAQDQARRELLVSDLVDTFRP